MHGICELFPTVTFLTIRISGSGKSTCLSCGWEFQTECGPARMCAWEVGGPGGGEHKSGPIFFFLVYADAPSDSWDKVSPRLALFTSKTQKSSVETSNLNFEFPSKELEGWLSSTGDIWIASKGSQESSGNKFCHCNKVRGCCLFSCYFWAMIRYREWAALLACELSRRWGFCSLPNKAGRSLREAQSWNSISLPVKLSIEC